jgi:hypothetical protein
MVCKYLRTEDRDIKHERMKEKLKKKSTRSLRMVLKLNVMPRIMVIGTHVLQVLQYGSGIINWRLEELKKTGRSGIYEQSADCNILHYE